ncbi:restriction endonuclease subunit S [Klebsiella pneumoniae]|uniref:restriction endonuclease subunit S n=2 Tax=Klebsiella/Raoultella group TaxID=2890311 RepID=UPI000D651110|nr:restriction endonuclease subunit S [Klebsiella pneumoniae]MCB3206105.1 restriction endonuclease subunit S [Klebsiella pneumoniae]MCM5918401.1 restriction endonuclease subunit S [Klebsiella pneumoniae]MCY0490127.1 restriction endonuclease subunit S [Klebsiella pneumoniae]MEC5582750.1 restriction endonuclease subunit S [Klebsiella pneumoniae]MEC6348061.1 restriction endonuclease subunit S [Klebsiella pneumoniae]
MGSNYIEMRLEDCMDAIIDYRGKTPKKVDNGIPLITAKIIKNGRIQEVSEFIAIDDYDNWMVRGLPLEGDVVLTTEAPLGEVAQLDARKVALAQRVITLRGKKGILENDYLLYLLQSSFVQNQLDGRASGSTVTGIKQSELREIILKLPPTTLQKSISHQLKCLDKKIDLNNKINQTLEQMSQTLFKSWFVDFDPVIDNALDAGNPIPETLQSRAELRQKVRNGADFKPLPVDIRTRFPAEFEETELGWVPKGWRIENFSEIAQLVKENVKSEDISTDVHYVGLEHLERKHILITNYGNGSEVSSNKSAFNKGDLLFGKLRPYFHKVAITPFSGICSTDILVFRAKEKYYKSLMAMYAFTDEFVAYANLRSTGTRMPRAEAKDLLKYKIVLPNENILEKFELLLNDYWSKGQLNNNESKQLTALRDTLLPKLISGELSLEDLPDLVTQTEPA